MSARRVEPAAVVRTLLPYLVGAVVALAAGQGIVLPETALAAVIEPALEPAVAFLVGGGYYLVGRVLETRAGRTAQAVGRFLLSLNTTNNTPVYVPATDINAASDAAGA